MKIEDYDDLNGRYQDVYKNESVPAPDKIWSGIEDELFPKKKRRGVVFWLSCALGILVLGGLTVFIIQKSAQPTGLQVAQKRNVGKEKRKIHFLEKTTWENKNDDAQGRKKSIWSLPAEANNKVSRAIGHASGENTTFQYSLNNPGKEFSTGINQEQFNKEAYKNNVPILAVLQLPIKSITQIERATINNLEIFTSVFDQKSSCEPIFSVGYNVFVGKNVRMVSGTFDLDQSPAKRKSDKRIALNQLSHNLTLQYRISDKFTLSTGVGYGIAQSTSKWYNRPTFLPSGQNALRFQTSEGYCSVSDTSLINSLNNGDTSDLKLQFNQSVQVLTFPVMGSRNYIKNKWTTSLNFGLSADLHFNSRLSFKLEENSGVRDLVAELDDPKTNMSLQALLGVRFNYRINSRFEAFAEQRLSVPITSYLHTDTYKAYSANMNLGLGLRFFFPCALN